MAAITRQHALLGEEGQVRPSLAKVCDEAVRGGSA
jgi:hypothetical protein